MSAQRAREGWLAGGEELPPSVPDHAAVGWLAPGFASPEFLDRLADALALLTAHGADVVGALATLAAWQPRSPAPVPGPLAAVGGLLEARLVARPEVEASALLAELAAVRRLAAALAVAAVRQPGAAGIEDEVWAPATTRFGAAPTLEALNRERAVRRAALLRAAAARRQAASADPSEANPKADFGDPFDRVPFVHLVLPPVGLAQARDGSTPEPVEAALPSTASAQPVRPAPAAAPASRASEATAPEPTPEAVDDPFADALAFGDDGAFDGAAAFEATRAQLAAEGPLEAARPSDFSLAPLPAEPAESRSAPVELGLLWMDSSPPEALAPSADMRGDLPWRPAASAQLWPEASRGGRTAEGARAGEAGRAASGLGDFEWEEGGTGAEDTDEGPDPGPMAPAKRAKRKP